MFTFLLDRERGGDDTKYDVKYGVRINRRDRLSNVKVRQAVEAAAAV